MEKKLAEICELVGGQLIGDGSLSISDVAKIEDAEKGQITFISNPRYHQFIHDCRASAVIVSRDFNEKSEMAVIQVADPYYAFLKILKLFHPEQSFQAEGIHPTAVIETSSIGKHVSIGPYVVVGKGCSIGDRTVLLPGVVIMRDTTIGEDCILHANVCVRENVTIGNRVIVHCGTVIGSDGFGFAPLEGVYHKIPQIGTVVIEDDVELGANVTVDRATMGETRICKGAKLDNLIQVAHNCTIGENTVIAAQAGLSGSTRIGKGVRVGGQVGFAGHMTIGDGSAIGAQSGVSKSVPPGVMVSGYPAQPHRDEMRLEAAKRKLPRLLKELKDLKKRIQDLEQNKGKEC